MCMQLQVCPPHFVHEPCFCQIVFYVLRWFISYMSLVHFVFLLHCKAHCAQRNLGNSALEKGYIIIISTGSMSSLR